MNKNKVNMKCEWIKLKHTENKKCDKKIEHHLCHQEHEIKKGKAKICRYINLFKFQAQVDNLHTACCKEMFDIYKREEMMRSHRTRFKWLKEEDANIKFFHKTAIMRRRANSNDSLFTKEGPIQVEVIIQNHILAQFKGIFGEKLILLNSNLFAFMLYFVLYIVSLGLRQDTLDL